MNPDQIKAEGLIVAKLLVTAGTFLGQSAVTAAGAALEAFLNSDQYLTVFNGVANAVTLFEKIVAWLQQNHPAGAKYLLAHGG